VGSIAQKSGEICTVQTDLQPISLKSDRLLGFKTPYEVFREQSGIDAETLVGYALIT